MRICFTKTKLQEEQHMTDNAIYKDIARRTGGDIYIGVVGPVRTGKSTLIKRFIQTLVLPYIDGESRRERARDEMPQSSSGRTVMTTEPKFIPEEAAEIRLDDGVSCRVRLIDCVGYMVSGAIGHTEDGEPRMVMTPWSQSPLPFEEAAEIGTRKVINEHSTIGIMVTTDGSIGEIDRASYVEAEARIVRELKSIDKPFVTVLNSAHPSDQNTAALAKELEARYEVPVIAVNCAEMGESDMLGIMKAVLYEFPMREIIVSMPSWVELLDDTSRLKIGLLKEVSECAAKVRRTGDLPAVFSEFADDSGAKARTERLSLGDGSADVEIHIPDRVFYGLLGEYSGFDITDERSLFARMTELKTIKSRYDRVSEALDEVNATGYGIVTPTVDDLTLEEPEIVKQPGGYGVKLKASAPSIHMIRADIHTELSPTVGTERQSEELVKYLLREFEEDPKKIWQSNMFGKSLYELIGEGLNAKLAHMPEDARGKLCDTLQRIINEGSGGLICILL